MVNKHQEATEVVLRILTRLLRDELKLPAFIEGRCYRSKGKNTDAQVYLLPTEEGEVIVTGSVPRQLLDYPDDRGMLFQVVVEATPSSLSAKREEIKELLFKHRYLF